MRLHSIFRYLISNPRPIQIEHTTQLLLAPRPLVEPPNQTDLAQAALLDFCARNNITISVTPICNTDIISVATLSNVPERLPYDSHTFPISIAKRYLGLPPTKTILDIKLLRLDGSTGEGPIGYIQPIYSSFGFGIRYVSVAENYAHQGLSKSLYLAAAIIGKELGFNRIAVRQQTFEGKYYGLQNRDIDKLFGTVPEILSTTVISTEKVLRNHISKKIFENWIASNLYYSKNTSRYKLREKIVI